MDTRELLKSFMLTPAPSGYEGEMAYKLKPEFEKYCDEVYIDRPGNCIGKITGSDSGAPRVMVFAHMDQLGFIVRKIEGDGFIQVDRLGGIPEKALPALNVCIRSEDGGWQGGVFGMKSHHASSAEDKYKVDPVTSLMIDIGARSAAEVNDLGIYPGCPVVYAPHYSELGGSRVSGTSVDNRGGCAALVGIAEILKAVRPACDVHLVGTVWEEFNLRGAMLAARAIKPDIAISLDVTLSGDTHDLASRYETVLGEGACVQLYSFHGRGTLNGTLPHEPLFRLVKRTAADAGMPFQRFATLGLLTDSAYVQLEGEGVACLEMGFPARYTHTPTEVCDIRDVEALSALVAASVGAIDRGFSINRY